MSNPYESPKQPNRFGTINAKRTTWLQRFALGLAIMVGLNLFRLWLTWRAWGTDGMEQIGFPFVFFERGGFSWHENWYYEMLAIDVGVAFVGAYAIAHAFRHGLIASFRRLRTWELDHVNRDEDCTMESSEVATEQSGEREPPMARKLKS